MMTIRRKRRATSALMVVLGVVVGFGLALAPSARAQSDAERQAIIKKVEHSVAKVIVEGENGGGHGSGYIVDDTGVLITNAHVVKPAKHLKKQLKRVYVTFPADGDKKEYKTEGWLDVQPTRDLCLLRIKPEGKKLVPLTLCDKIPTPGDTVFTFGSPLGFDNTPAFGHVTAYRKGSEIAEVMGGKDVFEKQQGYSLESTWVQHDAAMSPGNSGGPLLNMKGEVLGLNTWHIPRGENMNFATSADNIKKFLEKASKQIKAWPDLPEWKGAGEDEGGGGPSGNAGRTLTAWKDMNKALITLNKKIEAAEKKIKAIAPANPAKPMAGLTNRMKKKAKATEDMGEALREYASKIKAIDTRGVDPRLINLTVNESQIAERTSDTCREIGSALSTSTDPSAAAGLEGKLFALKEVSQKMRTDREVLRVTFTHQYNKPFPTLEETAKEMAQDPGGSEGKPNKKPKRVQPGDEDEGSSADEGDSDGLRTWTSQNGKFRIKAKLISVANGVVTLKTAKGKKIVVDIEKLSDDDQEFIRNRESASSAGSKEDES
jgi:S1-C subfamily serine protease